jgi:hypothetical protein
MAQKKKASKKRKSSVDIYFIHKAKSAGFLRNTLLLTLIGLFLIYFTTGMQKIGYNFRLAPPRDSLLDLPILWVSMALVVVLWYIYAKNNVKMNKTNKKKKRL